MQPQDTTYIYALSDPDTGEVRYIGKADDPHARYLRHLGAQELNANSYKARWIRSLLRSGKKPEMFIVDSVPSDQWQQAEREWIAACRDAGDRLTNTYAGGYGRQAGLKHPPEVVEKIRAGLTGRPVSQDTRRKLSEMFTGRVLDEEHRQKLSEAHRRRWASMSDDERQEYTKNLQREWSEESRQKLSKTRTGRKRGKSTASNFIGVSYFKRDQKWRAYIYENGKQTHLGYFDSETEAARAYDDAARLRGRAPAQLNFSSES